MNTITPESGYASVNGLELYYEIHGSGGTPLVLLHGGLGVVGMFAAILPALAEKRQVIGVELQGHGHTADTDRPFSFEAMGDDIALLLENLGIEKADVMGYSFGATVALQTAIRHPEKVNKLVFVSSVYKRDGWYSDTLAGMAAMNEDNAHMMQGTPMYDAYMAAAPRTDDWGRLVGKIGRFLSTDYDWTEQVAALQTPTLIVVGDRDSVRLSHAVEMYGLLGGGQKDSMSGMAGATPDDFAAQLAVIPGTLHWNIFMRRDLLLPPVLAFLDPAPPMMFG